MIRPDVAVLVGAWSALAVVICVAYLARALALWGAARWERRHCIPSEWIATHAPASWPCPGGPECRGGCSARREALDA